MPEGLGVHAGLQLENLGGCGRRALQRQVTTWLQTAAAQDSRCPPSIGWPAICHSLATAGQQVQAFPAYPSNRAQLPLTLHATYMSCSLARYTTPWAPSPSCTRLPSGSAMNCAGIKGVGQQHERGRSVKRGRSERVKEQPAWPRLRTSPPKVDAWRIEQRHAHACKASLPRCTFLQLPNPGPLPRLCPNLPAGQRRTSEGCLFPVPTAS